MTDIVSILILLGLFQGVLIVILLFTNISNKQNLNKWLIGILLFLIWTQIEFYLVRNRIRIDFFLLYGTRLGSWMLLGPMIMFYTRYVTNANPWRSSIQVLHFVPVILFTLVIPTVVPSLLPDRAIHYGILSLLKYYSLGTTPLQAIYAVVFMLQFIHLLLYLYWSHTILIQHGQKLKESHSNIEKINQDWLKKLIIAFSIILVAISLFMIILFVFNIYEREFDYLYALPVAAVIYWMVYKIIKQPEIIRNSAHAVEKYTKSSLREESAREYHERILDHMLNRKPYLNPELKLADLAEELDIHPHHVSQVLNDHIKSSFFDFINQYRIQEAKNKLKNKNGETILQIAFEVGFNNKASFNKYFKKITGKTPSEYLQD